MFKIGCDPELFLQDRTTKEFISAYGLLPGTKHNPFKVKKGAVQVDGCAFEFNVEPAETVEEFLQNVEAVTTVMKLMVRHKNSNLQLCVTPTAVFNQDYFNRLDDEAKRLGCEPDYNAYTERENDPPETKEPFRTGSGHIHIGWADDEDPHSKEHFFDCLTVAKQLDAGLYITSHLWDEDSKRRSLYGKIGAFRPKYYGIEWRPLSNAWVSDPDLQSWVFRAAKHSMELLHGKEVFSKNNYLNDLLMEIHEGREVTRDDALYHHEYMNARYDYPPLPSEYTK